MTKKMKKKLIWRLTRLPESKELSDLVLSGIMTKEEVREILFSEETKEDVDVKSLKSEIKFLRELVEKLSDKSETIRIIETIQKPYYKYDWWQPYHYWCGDSTTTYATAIDNNTMLCADTANSVLTAEGISSLNASSNFTDVKTF